MGTPPLKREVLGETVNVLNIGTKILLRDMMDGYLRSFGDFGEVRTFYASNIKSALRMFSETHVHIVISEMDLEDGSVQKLLKELGGISLLDDLWVILAVEETRDDLMALAVELDVRSVLVKPFSVFDLRAHFEKYRQRATFWKEPGIATLREALAAEREKRLTDSDRLVQQAVQNAPENPQVLFYAGVYFSRRQYDGVAEDFWRKALALRPQYVGALDRLGRSLIQKGKTEEGLGLLLQALRASPRNQDRVVYVARALAQQGAEHLSSLIERDENHGLARLELGKFLLFKKDYLGGLFQLEKALPLLPPEEQKEVIAYMALARKLGGLR